MPKKVYHWTIEEIVNELEKDWIDTWSTVFSLKIKPKRRTLDQNSYMHLVFEDCSQVMYKNTDTLFTPDTTKHFFKCMFLIEKKLKKRDGEIMIIPKETSKCSKEEIKEFIDKISWFMKDTYNHTIPDPEDKKLFERVDNNKF